MSITVEELATQAIALSPDDRERLVALLLASLPQQPDAELDAAWDSEIQARVAAVESATAAFVSSADVHQQARKIYER
jgi:putative addiction module component (TIGR02574 family)